MALDQNSPENEETKPFPESVEELLCFLQDEIHSPKDQFNTHGKFDYRTAEGILAIYKSIKPSGCSLTFSDTVEVRGNTNYLVATACLRFAGKSIEVTGEAMHTEQLKGMSNPAMITGAASSYARKYALCGLFAIDDGSQDPDSNDNRDSGNDQSNPPKNTRQYDDKQRDQHRDPPEVILAKTLLDAIKSAKDFAKIDRIKGDPDFQRDLERLSKMNERTGAHVKSKMATRMKELEFDGGQDQ